MASLSTPSKCLYAVFSKVGYERTLILAVLATLVTCILLGGCSEPAGTPVRFVFPVGYRGPCEIVERSGARQIPLVNGAYLYEFPSNGVLEVSAALGFRHWHEESASYASGQAVPIRLTSDPQPTSDSVALYSLGNTSKRFRFFVGTHEEMLLYVKHPHPETKAEEFWSGGFLTNSRATN